MDIKKIFAFAKDEFIYGGHLLYLGATCIVFTAATLLGIKVTWDFLVISYLIPYTVYAYNKLCEINSDVLTNSNRAKHIAKYAKYLPEILLLSIATILSLLLEFGKLSSFVLAVIMVLGGILYTEKFKMLTNKIIGFKSFYVSFSWTLLILLLAIYYSYPLNIAFFSVACFFYLRCIVNTAFFDIKDMESDRLSGLKTLSIVLGRNGILNFIHIVNMLSFVPLIYGVYVGILPQYTLALVIFVFYTVYYIRLAKDARTNIQNLSYVMVDGEYLLWPIVIILSKGIIYYKC